MVSPFVDITEPAGTVISGEQLEFISHRYHWALGYCHNKDVVEVGCSCGQGLGLLSGVARSVEAGDYSGSILNIAQTHYRERIPLRLFRLFDGQTLPFDDASKDVVILFEALYYIADAAQLLRECHRVLRSSGQILVATANKNFENFYPSSSSHHYFGVVELVALLHAQDFEVEVFGHLPVYPTAWRKMLKPVKKVAEAFGIAPKATSSSELLKHLVFGEIVFMPAELASPVRPLVPPTPLPVECADEVHRVLYCRATLRS